MLMQDYFLRVAKGTVATLFEGSFESFETGNRMGTIN
jgi:hypothetical protein